MVVQSIALPNVAGRSSEQEISVVPAESGPASAVHGAHGRSLDGPALVFVLVSTQAAWLALLGYGVFRVLG